MNDYFTNYYHSKPVLNIVLELLVFVFGVWSVFLAKKENYLVYPTGLVSTIISTYLLYKAGYLGDMILNFYYSIMSIYGWFIWTKKINNKPLPISTTTSKEKTIGLALFLITVIFIKIIYQLFDYRIEIVNYIDIFTAGIFFTAMWFMALKKIENWLLWIAGDILLIPLFMYRNLEILAFQYLIFTIIAIVAYIKWKKILIKTTSN